jgi:hypothetical protein
VRFFGGGLFFFSFLETFFFVFCFSLERIIHRLPKRTEPDLSKEIKKMADMSEAAAQFAILAF